MHGIRCIVALMVAFGAVSSAQAARLDGLWLQPVAEVSAADARLALSYPEESDAADSVRIWCDIVARRAFGPGLVRFTVLNTAGVAVQGGEQTVELFQGPNRCSFDLHPASLPMGTYTAVVSVDYLDDTPPLESAFALHRVSDAYIENRIAAAAAELSRLDAAESNGAEMSVRLKVAREVLDLARDDAASGDWRACEQKTDRVERGVAAAAAGMVFAEIAPAPTAAPVLHEGALQAQGERLTRAGQPAFPFGLALIAPSPEGVERAHRLGLSWVSVPLGPADSLSLDGTPRDIEAAYGPFFAAAERLGLGVLLRLAPDRLSPDMLAAYPGVSENGFVDVAHPDARMLFEKHCAAALPYVSRQVSVFAAEVIYEPRFHFFDEQHRQMFIEYIRQQYPDRIDLNRSWRSHLGDYADIELIGEKEHDYQNRRTFQYDFQHFHRGLGVDYCLWARETVRPHLPNLPLLATFGDDAFSEGEARHGVNREEVYAPFELAGSAITLRQAHAHYGLDYPAPAALLELAGAMSEGKPMIMTGDALELEAGATPEAVRGFVRTALWESLMSGADAIALSEDSAALRHPDALEAYIAAAHDSRRLAGIIAAFQDTPRHIGVVFSDSAKILNDGDPHMDSAWYGYEGASYGGYGLSYVTEHQIERGALAVFEAMVIPETPALSQVAFDELSRFVTEGGAVARIGTPIPYNEDGRSRTDVVRNTGNTVLVRGMNLPTEYLHAMDALIHRDALPVTPHAINGYGFPVEGVKTLYTEHEGEPYLYMVNLRKEEMLVNISGNLLSGSDLISGAAVQFPMTLKSCDPMIIRLDKLLYETEVAGL